MFKLKMSRCVCWTRWSRTVNASFWLVNVVHRSSWTIWLAMWSRSSTNARGMRMMRWLAMKWRGSCVCAKRTSRGKIVSAGRRKRCVICWRGRWWRRSSVRMLWRLTTMSKLFCGRGTNRTTRRKSSVLLTRSRRSILKTQASWNSKCMRRNPSKRRRKWIARSFSWTSRCWGRFSRSARGSLRSTARLNKETDDLFSHIS